MTTTASCSYQPDFVTNGYTGRPRYLEHNSSYNSSISHKRTGILKTTSSQSTIIAKQRSNALLNSVSRGDISLDAILAFPIDWQGIANELQWTRSHMATIPEIPEDDEDELVTLNPLATKTRRRVSASKQNRHAIWASASPRPLRLEASEDIPSSSSSLGLDFSPITGSENGYNSFFDEMDIDRPSTPDLYSSTFESSSSCSSSSSSHGESPVSTPTSSIYENTLPAIEDAHFELKSYCSIFNEFTTCAALSTEDVSSRFIPVHAELL